MWCIRKAHRKCCKKSMLLLLHTYKVIIYHIMYRHASPSDQERTHDASNPPYPFPPLKQQNSPKKSHPFVGICHQTLKLNPIILHESIDIPLLCRSLSLPASRLMTLDGMIVWCLRVTRAVHHRANFLMSPIFKVFLF